jgi:hypothetical protein
LLCLLSSSTCGRLFLSRVLKGLPNSLHFVFQPANSFIVGYPPMSQLGLEVPDGRLGLLKELLCMLARCDLLPQSLPYRFDFVGAGAVVVLPM